MLLAKDKNGTTKHNLETGWKCKVQWNGNACGKK